MSLCYAIMEVAECEHPGDTHHAIDLISSVDGVQTVRVLSDDYDSETIVVKIELDPSVWALRTRDYLMQELQNAGVCV